MNALALSEAQAQLRAAYNQKLDAAEARYAEQLTTSSQPETLRVAMVRQMSHAYCELIEARKALEARP